MTPRTMEREEIKAFIIRSIRNYQKTLWKKPYGDYYHYIAGQVVGMVKAFKEIGMIEKSDQLSSEIMDEINY